MAHNLSGPAGSLTFDIASRSVTLSIHKAGLLELADFLRILPTPKELRANDLLIVDLTKLELVYPTFVAIFSCWFQSMYDLLDGKPVQIIQPTSPGANQWLIEVGLYDSLTGNLSREPRLAGPITMALTASFPGESTAPDHISDHFMTLLRKTGLNLSEQPLRSTETAIAELVENIIKHANITTPAFAAAQVHPNTHKLSICLADAGVGIEESFRTGPYAVARGRLATGDNALSLAIEPLMSSKFGLGHSGYGLHYASELCRQAKGTFELTSGENSLVVFSQRQHIKNHDEWVGTIINILLDTRSTVSEEAIWNRIPSPEVNGYFTRFIEQATAQEAIKLSQFGRRLLTRDLGRIAIEHVHQHMRTLHSQDTVLSLDGIMTITPSFADEFFGGLYTQLGESGFQDRVRITDANSYAKQLIELVVYQRRVRDGHVTPDSQPS